NGNPGTCGFTVTKDPIAKPGSLAVSHTPGCDVTSDYMITNGGNSVGVDLLLHYLLQINRNGIDGVVTVEVRRTPSSSFTSFTVNTTGKTDDQVLEAICQGFAGLGLSAILTTPAAVGSPLDLLQPGTYAPGKNVVYLKEINTKIDAIR